MIILKQLNPVKKFIFFLVVALLSSNGSFASHKTSCNSKIISQPPWNDPSLHDDIKAPWNTIDKDNFLAPWNSVTCSKSKVNNYLIKNNINIKYFWN